MSSGYFVSLISQYGILLILTMSLNLTLGFTGIVNLAHIAFYAIGGYAAAIVGIKLGFPFPLAVLFAGTLCSVLGYLLIYLYRHLRGDYLALATLSFAFIIDNLLRNLTPLTGGVLGIVGINKPMYFDTSLTFMFVIIFVSLVSTWVMIRAGKSPWGLVLQATRDDERLARSYGKNTFLMKVKVMALSSFFSGVAGSLYAYMVSYLHPDSFYLKEIVFALTVVIVGGLASVRGTIIATALVFLFPELLRFLPITSTYVAPARSLIFSLFLLCIFVFKPRGLFGKVDLH